jgi:GABA permease
MPRRILVVANETASSDTLHSLLVGQAHDDDLEVLVVAPALVGRLDYWATDDRGARREATARLEHCLEALRSCGIEASGQIGDARPLLAIDDALVLFPADEIVVSTHPPTRSHWLARKIVERARERYDVPVRHVVGVAEPAVAA